MIQLHHLPVTSDNLRHRPLGNAKNVPEPGHGYHRVRLLSELQSQIYRFHSLRLSCPRCAEQPIDLPSLVAGCYRLLRWIRTCNRRHLGKLEAVIFSVYEHCLLREVRSTRNRFMTGSRQINDNPGGA